VQNKIIKHIWGGSKTESKPSIAIVALTDEEVRVKYKSLSKRALSIELKKHEKLRLKEEVKRKLYEQDEVDYI
jgi:hypothetical protein